MIEFNKGQTIALKKSTIWYNKADRQVFELAGKAGTGKTTVIHSLIDNIGLDIKTEVLFITFVGKATLPLRMNGLNAKTIHSVIYEQRLVYDLNPDGTPIFLSNGKIKKTFKFVKRANLDPRIKLIVIDERGMVSDSMFRDILSFGIPVIAVGDADHQLPPLFSAPIHVVPDAILDEIVRQKAGDPIIYLADLATKGIDIHTGKYSDRCFVIDNEYSHYTKLYKKPELILCGKNKTREKINNLVRYDIRKHRTPYPEFGDKMVCRKNNWSLEIDDIALINGLFGHVLNTYEESFNGVKMNIDFKPECIHKYFNDIPLDYEYLSMSYEDKKKYNMMYTNGNIFEFGYAATVHLTQGSQYGYVLLMEEQMGDFNFQKRWLYTGITRAKDTLVIVKKKKKKKWIF